MDCIEAPNLYTVRTYDSWVSERSLKRALEDFSPTRRAQAVRAEDCRGLPGRLPDAYRAGLMEAARRHLPLGSSVSRSALRKHLVPMGDQVSSQSCYVLWDGRSACTEVYNVPAGTAEASCCRTESMDYAAPGMWGVCDTLDAELIEVFLAEGYGAEADVSAAVDAGDEELLDVFRRYGVSLSPKRVIDGSCYVRPCRGGFEIDVPDGVVAISERAFGAGRLAMANWGPDVPKWLCAGGVDEHESVAFAPRELRCKRIKLPDSLRYIGPRAFEGVLAEDVVLPPSVAYIGPGAFYGAKRVMVFDSVSPEAYPAEDIVDVSNGVPNAPLGWIGIKPMECAPFCIANAYLADFEVIVRSAASGEVRYRVYLPFGQMKNESAHARYPGTVLERYQGIASVLVSSWGRGASFAFPRLDAMFDRLPNQRAKLKTAINRLAYPVDLPRETRERYEAYVARNARRAVAIMAEDDEVDELRALEHLLVKGRNLASLIEVCAKARRMRSYLKKLAQ